MKPMRHCVLLFFVAATGWASAQQPENSAVKPEPRPDEWWQRHTSFNERAKQGDVDLVFIGDSITQGWEDGGKDAWAKHYGSRKAMNLGISGDRTQHVLWRLDNGNIDGISPKLAVVMIGTNNFEDNSAREIADGVEAIVAKLQKKLPEMKILLLAIFPRSEKPDDAARAKLAEASRMFSKVTDGNKVVYLDIGAKFLEPDGRLPKEVMPDFLHPNAKGFEIWADAIEAQVKLMLGEK